MSFDVELDPSKAVEAVVSHGVFSGVIVYAEVKLSDPKPEQKIDSQYQLAIKVKSPKWETDQHYWYPVASKEGKPVNAIGSKWMNFLQMLHSTDAVKQGSLNLSGATGAEKIANLAKSLVGCNFEWEEINDYPQGVNILDYLKARAEGKLESVMKDSDGKERRLTKSVWVPTKYLGRVAVTGSATTGGYSQEKVSQFK